MKQWKIKINGEYYWFSNYVGTLFNADKWMTRDVLNVARANITLEELTR